MGKQILLFFSALTIFVVFGCSSTNYLPPISSLSLENQNYQFTDSSIAAAFEQNPQLTFPLKVAVYDTGFETLVLTDSLTHFEHIQKISHLSPALIEGERYYQRLAKPWYSHYYEPPETNLLQLRTLAAQSHSDLILFIGTSHTVYTDTNLLSLTYFGLVPMLFIKGNKIEVHSFIDMQLIDVRNGFIYTSYRNKLTSKDKFVKVNFERDVERLKENNVQNLTTDLLQELKRVLNRSDLELAQATK